MKHRNIKIVSIVLCVCLLGGLLYQSGLLAALASALNIGTTDPYEIKPKTDRTADLGTEANPFTVIEIVPDIEQGQFGYYIPGCEPVDIRFVEDNYSSSVNGVQVKSLGLIGGVYTERTEMLYSCYEDIPLDSRYAVFGEEGYTARDFVNQVSAYREENCWHQDFWSGDPGTQQKGYYQKVADGTGNYIAEQSYYFRGVALGQADGSSYVFKYQENGDYVWVKSDETPGENHLNDKVWMTRNDLFVCKSFHFVHNDTFIQHVYGQSSATFTSQVLVVTPEVINQHVDLIDQADLVFIHSAENQTVRTTGLWRVINNKSQYDPIRNFDDSNDLSNEAAIAIARAMGKENPPALILQTTSITGDLSMNLQKLKIMTLQYKPSFFCETFLDQVVADSAGRDKLYYSYAPTEELKNYWTTGSYNPDGVSTNGTFSFAPDGTNVSSHARTYNQNTSGVHVFEKIFAYHGSDPMLFLLTSQDKIPNVDDKNGGSVTGDLFDYFGEDADCSYLDAVQFILGQPSYTPKLRILEVQGCDEFIYQGEWKGTKTSEEWEKWYNELDASKKQKLEQWETWYDDNATKTSEEWEYWESVQGKYYFNFWWEDRNPLGISESVKTRLDEWNSWGMAASIPLEWQIYERSIGTERLNRWKSWQDDWGKQQYSTDWVERGMYRYILQEKVEAYGQEEIDKFLQWRDFARFMNSDIELNQLTLTEWRAWKDWQNSFGGLKQLKECEEWKRWKTWKEKQAYYRSYYQSLFPWYHPRTKEDNWLDDKELIEVTTMPSWEFVGSVGQYAYGETDEKGNPVLLTTSSSDDLTARYDLIIIGAMQDASNGANGYNAYRDGSWDRKDSHVELGNLVYTSVGGTFSSEEIRAMRLIERDANGNVYWNDRYTFPKNYSPQATMTEFLDVRYSGNDFTLKKVLELEDFLRAGKPIVVDEGLYKDGRVDTAKVDKSSKLYDLLTYKDKDTARNAQDNIFVHGSIDSGKMKQLISQNMCRIEFYTEGYPIEYGYTESDQNFSYKGGTATAQGVIKSEIYQSKNADGKAVLTYHFYIYGNENDSYNAFLNLDLDGDGVFGGSLKEHAEVDNMKAALSMSDKSSFVYDANEQPLGLDIYDPAMNKLGTTRPDGSGYILKAGTEYYATREVPPSQQGMIPWKLEVQSLANSYLRSSAIDYTAVYNQEKERIMVLQMNLMPSLNTTSDSRMTDGSFINNNVWGHGSTFTAFTTESVEVKWAYTDANGAHLTTRAERYQDFKERKAKNGGIPETNDKLYKKMTSNQAQTAAKFETYLAPVQEFDVNIQFMFNRDWYQLFGVSQTDADNETQAYREALRDWEEFLEDYDMLVFGFVDSCFFTDDKVFVEGLKEYVAQGKSLILSHDMISGTDLKEFSQTAGYSENRIYYPWLRTIAGQRRAYYNRKEDGTYAKSYREVIANGKRLTFVSDSNRYLSYGRSVFLGELPEEFSIGIEDSYNRNLDASLYSNEDLVNEWPDNSNFLGIYALNSFPETEVEITDRVSKFANLAPTGWNNAALTTLVKLANNGQITCYPYRIGNVIEVLQTHTQYYQLDMEYMQDGDVNVWFNLTDTHDPDVQEYYAKRGQSIPMPNTYVNEYSARNQDSRNSFFIYNKGNITYTGSGHGQAAYGQSDALMTDDEVKLFVNTMIAAYRQPAEAPYVELDNADAIANNGTGVYYLDYDGAYYKDSSDAAAADKKNENYPGTDYKDNGVDSSVAKSGIDSRVVTFADGTAWVRVEFSIYDMNSSGGTTAKRYHMNLYHGDVQLDPEDLSKVIVKKLEADANGRVTEEKEVGLGGVLTAEEKVLSGAYAPLPYYEVTASEAGERYVMYVPYSDVMNSADGISDYRIATYASYYNSKRYIKTDTSKKNVSIMLMPLFDLN